MLSSVPIHVTTITRGDTLANQIAGGQTIPHGMWYDPGQPAAGAQAAKPPTIFMATHLGIPVSTTHTITGAIVGVGATRRLSAVRWGVAGNILVAWVLTIPAAAAVAAACYWPVQGIFG